MHTVKQSAQVVARKSLLIAYAASASAWTAQWMGAIAHAKEFMVGAALMSSTLFFYSDLIRVLIMRERRASAVLLIATLKIVLVILAVQSGMLGNASSLTWLVGGFLLIVPASALIAYDQGDN